MARNKFASFDSAKLANKSTNKRTRFSDRLGVEMTKQGKEIPELASVTGTSYEMARRYVTGNGKPNYTRTEAIASWLGLDPDWLFYGDADDEKSDSTPVRKGTPVFKTSDRSFAGKPDRFVDIGLRSEVLAVEITNPLGIETPCANGRAFKAGDVCLIGNTGIGLGDYVLLEAKDSEALNKYMVRRVEFDAKMQPVFVSNVEGYPTLTTEDYKIVGRVTGIVCML